MRNEKLSIRNNIDLEELLNKQKEKLETSHQSYLKKAELLGERDGSLNLPQTEDTMVSPNEAMIKHKYQKLLADCYHKGKQFLDGPHLAYQTIVEKMEDLEKNREVIMNGELDIVEQKKSDKLAFIQEDFKTREEEINNYDKIVQRDYILAKQELQAIQQKVGRRSPIIHFKSTLGYVLLLIGIGICEVPLNLQIFQKFGEAFFITVIMASSLAIAIPVLAHFTGVFIKQRKEKREYLFFSILCVLLFIVFNFGVSIFRAFVLAENMGQAPDQLNIIIFTSLNLILFIIGVLASYFRHDESFELEYTYKRFQEEKAKYDIEKQKTHQQIKEISAIKNEKVKEVQDQYLNEKAKLNHLKDSLIEKKNSAAQVYDELLNSFTALEDYLDASYRVAVEKYRAANLIHRKNHMSPKAWEKGIRPLEFKFSKCAELDPN